MKRLGHRRHGSPPGRIGLWSRAWFITAALLFAIPAVCFAQGPLAVLFLGPGAPRPSVTGFEVGFDNSYGKELKAHGLESTSEPGVAYSLDRLKQFNVVVVVGNPAATVAAGQGVIPEDWQEFCAVLEDYHRLGGGILFMPVGSEHLSEARDLTANYLLEPYGAGVYPEALTDPNHTYKAERFRPFVWDYFWTSAITPHPVTAEVKNLFFPVIGSHQSAATVPLKVDNSWSVVVRGMDTARSVPVDPQTVKRSELELTYLWDQVGSVPSSPALIAVKAPADGGRLAIVPVYNTFTVSNWHNPVLGDVAMERGDDVRKSDLQTLLLNTYHWLAEPAEKTGAVGGFVYQPPTQDLTPLDWDAQPVPPKRKVLRGLIGAHSNLTDGRSTVAEYMRKAAELDLSFVVFTEPLALMNADKHAQLVAQCQAASTETCLALPGLGYQDSSGFYWVDFVTWKFPDASLITGGRMNSAHKWEFATWHAHCYQRAGQEKEDAWFQCMYTGVVPLSYEVDRLVDNSIKQYLHLEANNHALIPVSHVRVRDVDELARAAASAHLTCFWGEGPAEFQEAYQGNAMGTMDVYWVQRTFLSSGPSIDRWVCQNPLGFPWRLLANRFRVYLSASSAVGLQEVRVWNAATGELYRRFDPQGQKTFDAVIDEAHSRQWYLVAEVVDTLGRTALSSSLRTFTEGNRSWSMSDRFMTMNHPHDWNDDHTLIVQYTGADPGYVKSAPLAGLSPFNSFADTLMEVGIDGGLKSQAIAEVWPFINTDQGSEPSAPAYRHDLKLAAHDVHIVDYIGETKRPESAQPWYKAYEDPVPRQVDNQFADMAVRYYVYRPRFHQDAYVNLVEFTATIKQDLTLKGPVPLRVCNLRKNQPGVPGEFDHVTVKDTSGRTLNWKLAWQQGLAHEGTLGAGDYLTLYNFVGGAPLFVAITPVNYRLVGSGGGMGADIFLGREGDMLKKGDRLTARFLLLTLPMQQQTTNLWIEDFVHNLGVAGGKPGYLFTVTQGKVVSTRYELVFDAVQGGVELNLPQCDLPQNLPIVVRGVSDRLPCGIWESKGTSMREIGVYQGAAYATVDTRAQDSELYVGNLLQCSSPDLRVSMVPTVAGYLMEVHNPTEMAVKAVVSGNPSFPPLRGWKAEVTVPAGSSVRLTK